MWLPKWQGDLKTVTKHGLFTEQQVHYLKKSNRKKSMVLCFCMCAAAAEEMARKNMPAQDRRPLYMDAQATTPLVSYFLN